MAITISPGALHLPHWLPLDDQRALADECRALVDGPVPAYVPTLRSGSRMRVRMLSLGRHWNAQTYRYESTRTDFDGLPVPPLSDYWKALALAAAESVGMSINPDLCILNYYDGSDRLGLHQDNSESQRSLAAGVPVVSLSIGDTARFQFGGLQRGDKAATILLESGDAFVFGGPARLNFHGVSGIVPGTAPPELGLAGRFNLTFRQYDVLPDHPSSPHREQSADLTRSCPGCDEPYTLTPDEKRRLHDLGFLRRRCVRCGDLLVREATVRQRIERIPLDRERQRKWREDWERGIREPAQSGGTGDWRQHIRVLVNAPVPRGCGATVTAERASRTRAGDGDQVGRRAPRDAAAARHPIAVGAGPVAL